MPPAGSGTSEIKPGEDKMYTEAWSHGFKRRVEWSHKRKHGGGMGLKEMSSNLEKQEMVMFKDLEEVLSPA